MSHLHREENTDDDKEKEGDHELLVADDRHSSSFLVLAFRALTLLARYCCVLLGLGSHTSRLVGPTKFAVTSQPTGQAGHVLEAAP